MITEKEISEKRFSTDDSGNYPAAEVDDYLDSIRKSIIDRDKEIQDLKNKLKLLESENIGLKNMNSSWEKQYDDIVQKNKKFLNTEFGKVSVMERISRIDEKLDSILKKMDK